MKKLFLFALLFTLSSDSKGHLKFFKKAEAKELTYQLVLTPCGTGNYEWVCNGGNNARCFPIACGPVM